MCQQAFTAQLWGHALKRVDHPNSNNSRRTSLATPSKATHAGDVDALGLSAVLPLFPTWGDLEEGGAEGGGRGQGQGCGVGPGLDVPWRARGGRGWGGKGVGMSMGRCAKVAGLVLAKQAVNGSWKEGSSSQHMVSVRQVQTALQQSQRVSMPSTISSWGSGSTLATLCPWPSAVHTKCSEALLHQCR